MMPFKIGDFVETLDDDITAKVVDVERDQITVLTSEGFEMQFSARELILLGDVRKIEVSPDELNVARKEKEQDHKKKASSGRNPKNKKSPALEVDLHIEKLSPAAARMSTYDILEFQLETARKQINFAQRKGISRLIFIHGVGDGILKTELQFLLRKYPNAEYGEASYRKYGLGAMEVYLGKKK